MFARDKNKKPSWRGSELGALALAGFVKRPQAMDQIGAGGEKIDREAENVKNMSVAFVRAGAFRCG
jgi:hypothetical protein